MAYCIAGSFVWIGWLLLSLRSWMLHGLQVGILLSMKGHLLCVTTREKLQVLRLCCTLP